MNKTALRKKYLALRKQLSPAEAAQMSQQICTNLYDAIVKWQAKNVHVFLPIVDKLEVNLQPLIDLLQDKSKVRIITSRTNWEVMEMENLELQPSTALVLNKWGVPEPLGEKLIPEQEIDLVVVPLLAYDQRGHRVGYGKGFYDRFLARCKQTVIKAGVSFFEPELKISDVFEDDIALDYCFTPAKVFDFRQV